MSEWTDPSGERGPRAADSSDRGRDWGRLFRQADLDGVLRELSAWLRSSGDLQLVVETSGAQQAEVARTGRVHSTSAAQIVEIPGSPPWQLRVLRSAERKELAQGCVAEVATALTAWRASRDELARAREGLEVRTRELALLQELGRSAAEAVTPELLFRKVARVLQEGAGAEAVAAAWTWDGEIRSSVFLARPLVGDGARQLAAEAARLLGGSPPGTGATVDRLDAYDESQGSRGAIGAEDLLVLPILRKGTVAASMAVLLPEREEAHLRLVFTGANQVSLHLERILAVREAEQDRFRSVLDSMPQAVLLTDRFRKVILANPAAARLLPELAPGRTVDAIGELDLPPLAAKVLARPRETADGEARLETGTLLNVTLSAVSGDRNHVDGLVLVLSDVTERRRLQEQLAQTEKLSSLGQMISGVTHELNNPLASVLGYAQLVRSATSDETLARRLDVIHREARRCQRIVQNLLSFARRHEPERGPLSINEVVTSTLALVAYQLRVDNVHVRTELDPAAPSILGDGHQLQQAILNLVTNARHAIHESGSEGTITVRTRAGEEGVILEVSDDGPGIPERIRSRVFDPFFTTKSTGEGTGLGLSIVYGIVTSHDGTVRIRSREGEGTTFVIELPKGRATRRESTNEKRRLLDPPRAGRILVVDDEETVAHLICEALASRGHEAVLAHRREAALERLEAVEFDVVILDLRMPGLAGEAFQQEVQRRCPGLWRRTLLITGDTVSPESGALAARFDLPVLHKPFDIEDLLEAVHSRLGPAGST